MKERRPKILVWAPEKARAEVILRGLRDLGAELDLVLEDSVATRQLEERLYDVVVLDAVEPVGAGLLEGVNGTPLVAVGGNGTTPPGAEQVPLPLSFNLLRSAVERAIEPGS